MWPTDPVSRRLIIAILSFWFKHLSNNSYMSEETKWPWTSATAQDSLVKMSLYKVNSSNIRDAFKVVTYLVGQPCLIVTIEHLQRQNIKINDIITMKQQNQVIPARQVCRFLNGMKLHGNIKRYTFRCQLSNSNKFITVYTKETSSKLEETVNV